MQIYLISVLGGMRAFTVVEILSDEKSSDTQRSGDLRFYFTLAVPDDFILVIWTLNKGFTG
jgi:hypothetical protein